MNDNTTIDLLTLEYLTDWSLAISQLRYQLQHYMDTQRTDMSCASIIATREAMALLELASIKMQIAENERYKQ